MLGIAKKTSSVLLLNQSNKLSVYDINRIQTTLFIHSVVYHYAPACFSTFFTPLTALNNYSHRRKLNLQIQTSKTNTRKSNVYVRGPFLWNALPYEIQSIPSQIEFKRKIRDSIMIERLKSNDMSCI